MKSKVLNYVFFILWLDGSYELVTCNNLEDIADVLIEDYNLIDRIFEIDCY